MLQIRNKKMIIAIEVLKFLNWSNLYSTLFKLIAISHVYKTNNCTSI